MKRRLCFVILTFLILICGITQPVNAADNTKENEILFFVENHANTAEATCVTFGKYCLLGIRTKGIILKSDKFAGNSHFEGRAQAVGRRR